MVSFNMDMSTVAPSSGGGKNFPISPPTGWLCKVVAEEGVQMKQQQGTRLVFKLVGLEGEVMGQGADYGFNLNHPNPQTVEIAKSEIAAIAWVTGTLRPGSTYLADTGALFEKPFRVIVMQDEDPRYTRIVGVRTHDNVDPVALFNGKAQYTPYNGPGAAANNLPGGAPPGQAPQNFGGGAPQGQSQGQAGFGGQPQGQGQAPQGQAGGFGAPQGQPNGAPQGQQQGQWGGAGAPGQPQGGQTQGGQWGGAPQGQQGQQPQGDPNGGAPQGQNGGWGAPQGQQQAQGQQQGNGGWGAPQGGQQPQWGG